MKILSGVLLLIVAGALGSSYTFGVLAEKRYKEALGGLGGLGFIEVAHQRYERGLLSSNTETVFRIGYPEWGFDLVSTGRVVHGPFAIGDIFYGHIDPSPALAVVTNVLRVKNFPNSSPMPQLAEWALPSAHLSARIPFGGTFRINLSMDPVSAERDGVKVDFKGATGGFLLGKGPSGATVALASPLVAVNNPSRAFYLSGLEATLELRHGEAFPSFNLKVRAGNAGAKGGSLDFSFSDIVFTAEASGSEEMITLSQGLTIGEISAEGKRYGPATFGLVARNIDAEALSLIAKTLSEGEVLAGTGDEKRREALVLKLVSLLPQIMLRSPEVEVTEVTLKTDGGAIRGWFKLFVDGSTRPSLRDLLTPSAVRAELRFSIPEENLAEIMEAGIISRMRLEAKEKNIPPPSEEELGVRARRASLREIERLRKEGFLVSQDGNYYVHASFKQGRLEVNGREVKSSAALTGKNTLRSIP
ncbi:MAG: DUF945 family protein [Candidatus Methanosuratincola sp.]|jgi:uncharacterized protein YdgA (DUF945 family)